MLRYNASLVTHVDQIILFVSNHCFLSHSIYPSFGSICGGGYIEFMSFVIESEEKTG